MVARRLSRTDRFYLELFTLYGAHSVALAQGLYNRFMESYQDQSTQGQIEQRKLLSQLTDVLSHHLNLIIEGIEERQKAFDQEERAIYDSTHPDDATDAHYLNLITMYGRHWIGGAHGGSYALNKLLFDDPHPLTSEEFQLFIEFIGKELKNFHDLIQESIRARHPL